MKQVLTVLVFLLMSIGVWAGDVVIVKNPSNGGEVSASQAAAGQTCTLTVTPASGNYLKSIKAVTTVSGNALQAPGRRTGSINIDETELTITSDASADPSGVTTHTFTMPEDGNLNVEVTAEFEARISISNATITLATTSFTYDGTAKQPAVSSVVVDGTTLNANEYTVSWSNNINVCTTATVTVEGQRAYTGTKTATFTILAKSITSDMITLTASSFVYNGETQTPGVTVMDGNTSLKEKTDYTISYQLLDGETAVDADDTKDVATYNVVVTGNGNYTGSATKSFAITKAQLENFSVSLEGWTFNTTANTPIVSGNLGNGEVTYTYSINTENPEEQSFTTTVPENAGSYIVKATVAETENYASASATAEFTISKADITPTVTLTGWTYGTTANTPTVSGNPGNGAVTYTYSVNTENPEGQSFEATVPENAGSYIVKATVVATTNYNAGEATSTFTIAKADMSMVSVSYEDLVYNGSAQQLFTVNNVPENATVKYICQKITDPNQMICDPNDDMFTTDVPSATNAGYYGIIYKIEETNNYNGTEASQTYCVQIDAATITEVTLDATSLSYNSADQTVTITSVKAGNLVLGADDYTVTLDGVAVTGNITAKYVGEYVVAVTGKGNFKGTESATFSIVNRTLADNEVEFHNNWATFFSKDGDVKLPAGIGAYVATEVGDGVVTVSQIKYIPERIPVLLNNATETAGTVEFDVEMGVNLLLHAYEDIDVSDFDEPVYGLYNGSMMRVSGTIPAGKNYLMVSNPQSPRMLTIVFDDTVTAISQIKNDNSTNENYYDLMGRKIQKPSKKGLYIQNGRVVVAGNK